MSVDRDGLPSKGASDDAPENYPWLGRTKLRILASMSRLTVGDQGATVVRRRGVRAVLDDAADFDMLPVQLVHRVSPTGRYHVGVGCWQLQPDDARALAAHLIELADLADEPDRPGGVRDE